MTPLNYEERLLLALDVAEQCVWEWHIPSGTVVVGGSLSKFLGYGENEIKNTAAQWRDLIHTEDLSVAATVSADHANGRLDKVDLELRLRDIEGRWWWVQLRGMITETGDDGRPVRGIGIVDYAQNRNKSTRGRGPLQAQTIHRQKLEALGALASGIAHDFNNILSGVLGFADMAMVEARGNESVGAHISEAIKAAERAQELIAQILRFARMSDQERAPLRLHSIVKEVSKLLRGTLPPTISVTAEIQEDCPPVEAMPASVHQILMNLGINAYHSMIDQCESPIESDKDSKLSIRLNRVDVASPLFLTTGTVKVGEWVVLEVEDTGCGVRDDLLSKIFEPYFSTKEDGLGMGMGLATVQTLVSSLGGVVGLNTKPGTGSTFSVYLPACDEAENEVRGSGVGPEPIGNERVLLVDDERIILDIGLASLNRYGYQVTTCHDGIEALGVFSTCPDDFDIVITDLVMPNMTGKELSARILAKRPDFPIIICTGFSEKLSKADALVLGIRNVAYKPFVGRDLAVMIREVFDSQKG